jgi:hypothetical protein
MAMKVIPLRFASLARASILGLGVSPTYACNDALGKTAEQPPAAKSDQLQPSSDQLIFAELLVLGLAMIQEPRYETYPCYRCLGPRAEPGPPWFNPPGMQTWRLADAPRQYADSLDLQCPTENGWR